MSLQSVNGVFHERIGESEESRVFTSAPILNYDIIKNNLLNTVDNSITSFDQFPDPYLFKGMKEAVDIFVWAVSNNKRILCVCDSDCDGVGTFMTQTEFFKHLGYQNVEFLIVKRSEGYGFIPKNLKDCQMKPDLVITSDNGITAHAATDLCNQMGIYTIITDHHQVNHKGVPNATAVIDPHQPGCLFPYKDINGTFVLWYFLYAVANKLMLNFRQYWFEMMLPELVLTTISDVMPLKHLNRFVVKFGLPKYFSSQRSWVKAFMEDKTELSAEDLAFGLIPSINAASRLADAKDAANYLWAPSYMVAKEWLNYLKQLNDNRKEKQELLDKTIMKDYNAFIEQPFILIPGYGEIFHKGILGPCSGRIAEKFNKPTIVMTLSHDGSYYSGSGRSVGSVDLLGIVKNSKYVDLDRSGGHKAACGVTIPKQNVEYFWKDVQDVTSNLSKDLFRPKIVAMGKLGLNLIDTDMYEMIRSFEPYGEAFQKPTFLVEGIVKDIRLLGKLKNHMTGTIEDNTGSKMKFTWFFFNELLKSGDRKRFMYTIVKDDFASKKSGTLELALHIKNIISNI